MDHTVSPASYAFIDERTEPYPRLPSQPTLVLIYRPRRDERLSWPGRDSDSAAYLGEVKLQRIVSGQRHEQTASEELRERVAMIVEEERIVAQRRHGDADLRQVVEVLQHGSLAHSGKVTDDVVEPLNEKRSCMGRVVNGLRSFRLHTHVFIREWNEPYRPLRRCLSNVLRILGRIERVIYALAYCDRRSRSVVFKSVCLSQTAWNPTAPCTQNCMNRPPVCGSDT